MGVRGEVGVIGDKGDAGLGGEGESGVFKYKIVFDAGFEIPAVVFVVIVGGQHIGGDDGGVGASEPGVVKGDLDVSFAGVHVIAFGEDIGDVAAFNGEGAEVPVETKIGPDFLESGDGIGGVDINEGSDEGVGELSEIEIEAAVNWRLVEWACSPGRDRLTPR